MKKNMIAFAIRLLGYTIILLIIYLFIKNSIPVKFYYENTLYLFAFFFILNLTFHYGLLTSFAKSSRSFMSYYMISTFLKLFLLMYYHIEIHDICKYYSFDLLQHKQNL